MQGKGVTYELKRGWKALTKAILEVLIREIGSESLRKDVRTSSIYGDSLGKRWKDLFNAGEEGLPSDGSRCWKMALLQGKVAVSRMEELVE